MNTSNCGGRGGNNRGGRGGRQARRGHGHGRNIFLGSQTNDQWQKHSNEGKEKVYERVTEFFRAKEPSWQ